MVDSFKQRVLDEVRRRRRLGAPEVELPTGRSPFKPQRGVGSDVFAGLGRTQFGAAKGQQLDLARRRAVARAAREEEERKAREEEERRMKGQAAAADIAKLRQQAALRAKGTAASGVRMGGPSLGALSGAIDASSPPAPVTAYGQKADEAIRLARMAIAQQLMQGKAPPVAAIARLMWEHVAMQKAMAAKRVSQATFDMAVKDAFEQAEAIGAVAAGGKWDRDRTLAEIDKVLIAVGEDHAENPRVDPTGAAVGDEDPGQGPEKVDDRTVALSSQFGQFIDAADAVVEALAKLNSQKTANAGAAGGAAGTEILNAMATAVDEAFDESHNSDVLDAWITGEGDVDRKGILNRIGNHAAAGVGAAYDVWLDKANLEGVATSPEPDAYDKYLEKLNEFVDSRLIADLIQSAIQEVVGSGMPARVVESFSPRRIRSAIRQLFEATPKLGAPRFGVEPARRAQDPERLDPGTDVPELENEALAQQIRDWKQLTDAKKAIEAQAAELRANLETGQVRKGLKGGLSLGDINKQITALYEKQIEPALLEMDQQALRVDDVVYKVLKSSRTIAKWQAIAKAMQRDVRVALTGEMDRMRAEGFAARADAIAVALAQVNSAMEQAVGEAMRLLEQADALLPEERVYTTPYATLKKQESIGDSIGGVFMRGVRAVVTGARRLWGWVTGLRSAVDDLEMAADETLRALE